MSPSTEQGLNSGERIVAKEPCAVYKCHTQRYQLAQKYIGEKSEIMDFGCGIGFGCFLMSAYAESVLGIEKDYETVEHARRWFSRDNILYLNESKIPLASQFHIITAFEVIEHHESGEQLVADFYNSLYVGGLLIVSVPNQDAVPFNEGEHKFHYRHYTSKELTQLLEGAGFKIELKVNQPSKRFPELMAGFGGWTNLAVCRRIS